MYPIFGPPPMRVVYHGPLPRGCYFGADGATVIAETRTDEQIAYFQFLHLGTWIGIPRYDAVDDRFFLEWGYCLMPREVCQARVN